MSPRQSPSRHDATARRFLAAAARLIDAYLNDQPRGNLPTRLRSVRFPAALDWLRTEDVIRLAAAGGAAGASRKAFFNRWPTREEFLPDAVVYALVYDEETQDPKEQAKAMPAYAAVAAPFSAAVLRISDACDSLRQHPAATSPCTWACCCLSTRGCGRRYCPPCAPTPGLGRRVCSPAR